MSIDLNALNKAAAGDPATKVTVNKRWLQEVHKLLLEGERDKAALARSRTVHELRDRMDTILGRVNGRH